MLREGFLIYSGKRIKENPQKVFETEKWNNASKSYKKVTTLFLHN
jgi:hypothetical protein